MDPVSLILEALAAGAVAAVKETAGNAIKDGYAALKAAIKNAWTGSDDSAEVLLNEYENDPEIYQTPIETKLRQQGLDKNDEIIAKADALMKQVDPEGHAAGKYVLTIANSGNLQVGDGNTQINIEGDAHTGSGNFNKTVTNQKD